MKRTHIKFEDHIYTKEVHGSYTKYTLKKPDSDYIYLVEFLSGNGVTLITGDWGMWCVKRELHPSPDGYISDHYIAEKIDYSYTGQKAEELDSEATIILIEAYLDGTHEDLEDDYPLSDDERDYLEYCLGEVEDNDALYDLAAFSTARCGRFSDTEAVPRIMKIKRYLLCIFDAFDEMCNREKQICDKEVGLIPINTRLATKDGRKRGNAVVCGYKEPESGADLFLYQIITDYGISSQLTNEEIHTLYYLNGIVDKSHKNFTLIEV